MGASAATRAFLAEHGETIEAEFARFDTDGNGVIDMNEMKSIILELIETDAKLSRCGPADVEELSSLVHKKFSKQGRMTKTQFVKLFQVALVDQKQTTKFLRMSWSDLGIARMKTAQKEWEQHLVGRSTETVSRMGSKDSQGQRSPVAHPVHPVSM